MNETLKDLIETAIKKGFADIEIKVHDYKVVYAIIKEKIKID